MQKAIKLLLTSVFAVALMLSLYSCDFLVKKECEQKSEKINQLEHENKRMQFFLSKMRDSISEMIDSE